MPHAVPLHVALPFEGTGHAVQDAPQVLVELLLSHVPPQLCVPLAQHLPLEHTPPPHATPQPPQLFGSVCSSTHALPHAL
jgi:hypothetical protein